MDVPLGQPIESAGTIKQVVEAALTGVDRHDPIDEALIAALEAASALVQVRRLGTEHADDVRTGLLGEALASARAAVVAVGFALTDAKDVARARGRVDAVPAGGADRAVRSTPTGPVRGKQVDRSAWRTGLGSSPIHHGEIIQGAFRVAGRIRRGLVTLPCELYRSHAEFVPAAGGPVTVRPTWRTKARRAAELTVKEVETVLGHRLGGELTVTSDVPLCRGFGSSTSDVLASIRAVTDAFAVPLSRATVARLAVRAETASDSLMFDEHAVLFAHREGELIEDFGCRLPPVRVVGFGTGEGIDTLASLPARYTQRELDMFGELRVMLRAALAARDVGMIGEVATASTWINQNHLPIPELARVCAVAREAGAVGVHTAHSGDIAGILFDLRDPDLGHRCDMAQKLLRGIGFTEQWRFSTDD